MKNNRQAAILRIIEEQEVCTQEMLLETLKKYGYDVTQATVSRDIKSMSLTKMQTAGGKYRYCQPESEQNERSVLKFKSVFLEAVISADYAQNMAAIKCHVGMGNAACAALDLMDMGDVVGTLAGDDTIFVLLRNQNDAKLFVEKLKKIINN